MTTVEAELVLAAKELMEIVEGSKAPPHPWRSPGLWSGCGERLKDTPEWCKFYVALARYHRLGYRPNLEIYHPNLDGPAEPYGLSMDKDDKNK